MGRDGSTARTPRLPSGERLAFLSPTCSLASGMMSQLAGLCHTVFWLAAL